MCVLRDCPGNQKLIATVGVTIGHDQMGVSCVFMSKKFVEASFLCVYACVSMSKHEATINGLWRKSFTKWRLY